LLRPWCQAFLPRRRSRGHPRQPHAQDLPTASHQGPDYQERRRTPRHWRASRLPSGRKRHPLLPKNGRCRSARRDHRNPRTVWWRPLGVGIRHNLPLADWDCTWPSLNRVQNMGGHIRPPRGLLVWQPLQPMRFLLAVRTPLGSLRNRCRGWGGPADGWVVSSMLTPTPRGGAWKCLRIAPPSTT